MSAHVEELGEDKVRLTVAVPSHDIHHAVEHAATDLAASVRIPGFRPGKVPMPILLQRVGKERLYTEAVESHIGNWFWNAAATEKIQPVEQPHYEYDLPSSDAEDWSFTATVAVQPKPEPADWTTLEVGYEDPDVPEELVQAQLEALQRTVADLQPVDGRPAEPGDTVVLDLISGDEAQRDYVVDLGQGRLIEEIESALVGMTAGASKEVSYELADESQRTVTATVKEVREAVLPPLDDDFARAASEFDTLEELRADLDGKMRDQIAHALEVEFRARVVDELIRASNVSVGGPLVETRTRELLAGLGRSLQSRGIDPDAYFTLTGQSPEELQQRLRGEAALSVARELVLEAVADKLGIEVSDDEIRAVLREQGAEDAEIDEIFEAERHEQLRDDLRLRNALDRVAAEVKRIPAEQAAARESIWTPDKEKPDTEAKLWTPGSKEPA